MKLCFALNPKNDYQLSHMHAEFAAHGIDSCKLVDSCDTLATSVSNDRTDILVVDTELPGQDLFQNIHRIKSQKNIQVIFLAPREDYHYAYQAMKSGACELLVAPFTHEQLISAIKEAAEINRMNRAPVISGRQTSRSVFADDLSNIFSSPKTIEDINLAYSTAFRPGLFRVVSFCANFPNVEHISEITKQVWHTARSFLEHNAPLYTYDVVHALIYNEVRIILNYPEENDAEILRLLPIMFLHVESIFKSSPVLELFMGVGQEYPDINMLSVSSEESKNGIWVRMSANHPENKIVFYTNNADISSEYQVKILDLGQRIQRSIDHLNTTAFTDAVNAFFSLPEDILCSSLAKQTILIQLRYLRDVYRARIDSFSNATAFYYSTKITLLTSRSFLEYKSRYIEAFVGIFNLLQATADTKQHRTIENIKTIINRNYMNNITLSSVAEEIQLSPNYLSRIFRESTGQTFSEYLLEHRLTAAKTLLQKTNYRIKEISSTVGFSDQRYFSRIFIRNTGLTPSEYRNIHKSN